MFTLTTMTSRLALGASLSVALLVAAPRAQAALGEPLESVQADRAALRAVDRGSEVRRSYSVHELRAGGTVIREYAGPSGTVFGIAWKGLAHPDLTQLLGKYAPEYQDARRKAHRQAGRRHQRLETDHLVVETWGQMRNLQGRAYDPSLLPPGVAPDEIT